MATNLYEYYTSKGQALPSLAERTKLAQQAGISNYGGTAQQNTALLSYLSGSGSKTTSPTTSVQTPKSAPLASAGQVLGASSQQPISKLEAMFGPDQAAQDKGSQYLMENVYNKPVEQSINYIKPRQADESLTEYAQRLKNEPFYLAGYGDLPDQRPVTLTASQVRAKAKDFGLEGTGFDFGKLAGLTASDVNSILSMKGSELKGQTSERTSFALNSDYFTPISSAKKLFDAFNVGIKSATDPWNTDKDKSQKKNKLFEDTSLQLAQLFDSPATFNAYYTQDSEFKKLMDGFQKSGLPVDQVRSKIMGTGNENASIQNPLNQNPALYAEKPPLPKVEAKNPMLKDFADTTNAQIADMAGIPEQQRQFYFGDTGYFTKIRQDAEANLAELDKSYKQIERDTQADYEVNIKRAEFEAKKQLAEIEESRQDAKTYMTGMLAKLGALTTTGEAPAALGRLEQKYQQMASNTENALFNAKATLASEKSKILANINAEKLGKMQSIRSDLTKSSYEIQRELMNIENQSKKDINSLISSFNKESLALDKEALAEANKLKLEYQKQFYKTASGGSSSYSSVVGGGLNSLAPELQAIYNNPALLNNYTPTEKGKIQNALARAGLDMARFGLNNMNAGQRDQVDLFDTLVSEANNAKAILTDKKLDTGPLASRIKAGQAMFGGAKDFTNYRSVIDNMGSILLKARSGAAVTPQEFERIAGFIPSRNDDEKTASTKIDRFYEELERARQNYIKRATQTTFQISQEAQGGGASLQSVLGGGSQQSGGNTYQSQSGKSYVLPN